MASIAFYQDILEQEISRLEFPAKPAHLYQPVRYILSLGGKRLRPVLTLMTCDFFSQEVSKALPAALAVELFHNFSLIHDDIMDEAPLRRGKETVHNKWDINTGILSGDAMLILAYQFFEKYKPETFRKLAMLFSKTALEVCEGQQLDMNFETQEEVTLENYLQMITLKTAVLLAASLKMGAIVANAAEADQSNIYAFGKNLGIAFQLQDDYLDVFGDPKTFGKQVGGDIIENKKTYLFLKALEKATDKQKLILQNGILNNYTAVEKVKKVTTIYKETGADKATLAEINHYTQQAFIHLDKVGIATENKNTLKALGKQLMQRTI